MTTFLAITCIKRVLGREVEVPKINWVYVISPLKNTRCGVKFINFIDEYFHLNLAYLQNKCFQKLHTQTRSSDLTLEVWGRGWVAGSWYQVGQSDFQTDYCINLPITVLKKKFYISYFHLQPLQLFFAKIKDLNYGLPFLSIVCSSPYFLPVSRMGKKFFVKNALNFHFQC